MEVFAAIADTQGVDGVQKDPTDMVTSTTDADSGSGDAGVDGGGDVGGGGVSVGDGVGGASVPSGLLEVVVVDLQRRWRQLQSRGDAGECET